MFCFQELPESQRADAVSSMVYEASARIRDPVYGCAGAICQLQKQVNELHAQLAKAQAEVSNMQLQQANLISLLCNCMEVAQSPQQNNSQQSVDMMNFISSPQSYQISNHTSFMEEWEPLWAWLNNINHWFYKLIKVPWNSPKKEKLLKEYLIN